MQCSTNVCFSAADTESKSSLEDGEGSVGVSPCKEGDSDHIKSGSISQQDEPQTTEIVHTPSISSSSRVEGTTVPETLPLSRNEDNEYILDGFDFSTGVSICQELDLDEEDAHEGVKSPSQLSDVLLKALHVNVDGSATYSSLSAHISRNTTTRGECGLVRWGGVCEVTDHRDAHTVLLT